MRVLLVGLGSIGRRHLQLLKERPEVTDIVACRREVTGIDGVREFDEIESALNTEPDIAFVTNPTDQHVETALECARSDCHLFVEKPLSHNLNGVSTLCEIVTQRDLVTMVGCQLRFTPVLQRVAELLEERRYGGILSFEAYSGSYLPDWRKNSDYRNSYSADPRRGGGAVLDLIHELDYANWLFGPFDDLCGRAGNVSSLEIESEDIGVMTVETDQLVGTIHVDFCRPTPRRTLEVVCEDSVITADLLSQNITIDRPSENRIEEFDYERNVAFREQLKHFLAAVKNNHVTCNPVTQGKDVLSLALKAKSSHK